MKALIVVNDPPFGTEGAHNARSLTDADPMDGTRRRSMSAPAEETTAADKVLVF